MEREQIKAWTGGDVIMARFMRENFFKVRVKGKPTVTGNDKPRIRTMNNAIRRRFILVPFLNKPGVIDLDLELKLQAEAPAILRWMINGCLSWQQQGLGKPSEMIKAATNEYFEQQDHIQTWLDMHCVVNSKLTAGLMDAFDSWREFCRPHQPGSPGKFQGQADRARICSG